MVKQRLGKRQRRLKASLTEKTGNFCESSTIHGLSDLWSAASWYQRIFWSISFLAASCSVVYGCYMIVDQYIKSPVVISYIVRDEHQKELPNIVLCPFNRFNVSFFRENDVNDTMIEYIQSVFQMGKPYRFQWDAEGLSKSKKKVAESGAAELDSLLERLGNITFDTLIDRASFSCNSFIKYCVNSTRLYDCCEHAGAVLNMAGKCVQLKGAMQKNSGFGFGMTIVIKVPTDDYLSPGATALHNQGISVKLAEPGKGLDFDITFIPTGVHALMPLRATKYEFMNSPEYQCFGQESLEGYSPLQCFDNCFFKKSTEICKCRLIASTNLTYPACKPMQQASCLIPETRKIYQADPGFLHKCQEDCKRPCVYWGYQPTVSYAKFPSETLFQYVPKDREDWNGYIILDVFYEKLEYTTIKHFPSMTAVTFIANLGGQIGLWIGGSILSILWDCCVNRKRKRSGTSVGEDTEAEAELGPDSIDSRNHNKIANGSAKLQKSPEAAANQTKINNDYCSNSGGSSRDQRTPSPLGELLHKTSFSGIPGARLAHYDTLDSEELETPPSLPPLDSLLKPHSALDYGSDQKLLNSATSSEGVVPWVEEEETTHADECFRQIYPRSGVSLCSSKANLDDDAKSALLRSPKNIQYSNTTQYPRHPMVTAAPSPKSTESSELHSEDMEPVWRTLSKENETSRD